MNPLAPGATIGILGGGQLGRMLSVAASRLGFRCHIFEPGAAPAADVASAHTKAPWDDMAALRAFAASVQAVTLEFENVPLATLDILDPLVPVRPGRRALEISQDRLTEKMFLDGLGLRVAPYAEIADAADLERALGETGRPAILKTRRFGYDGKGQIRINEDDDAPRALQTLNGAAAIAEGVVDFEREVSVIVARSLTGEVACFDPSENVHRDGILRITTVPARLSARQKADAALLAGQIVNALDFVGVMGVELFVEGDGFIVNEIAPRVHNSGHWTQAACTIDQFEQHIRAIAGWPLGDGRRHADVDMENLIGGDIAKVVDLAKDPTASVHLYGKEEVRPGRKMGHVNWLRTDHKPR